MSVWFIDSWLWIWKLLKMLLQTSYTPTCLTQCLQGRSQDCTFVRKVPTVNPKMGSITFYVYFLTWRFKRRIKYWIVNSDMLKDYLLFCWMLKNTGINLWWYEDTEDVWVLHWRMKANKTSVIKVQRTSMKHCNVTEILILTLCTLCSGKICHSKETDAQHIVIIIMRVV